MFRLHNCMTDLSSGPMTASPWISDFPGQYPIQSSKFLLTLVRLVYSLGSTQSDYIGLQLIWPFWRLSYFEHFSVLFLFWSPKSVSPTSQSPQVLSVHVVGSRLRRSTSKGSWLSSQGQVPPGCLPRTVSAHRSAHGAAHPPESSYSFKYAKSALVHALFLSSFKN